MQTQVWKADPGLSLYTDLLYQANERAWAPLVGLEMNLGVLALRTGIKDQHGSKQFSVGLGVNLGRLNLDYAVGLLQDFGAQHRMSVAYAFATPTREPSSPAESPYRIKPEEGSLFKINR
jgi:hypothetical protein